MVELEVVEQVMDLYSISNNLHQAPCLSKGVRLPDVAASRTRVQNSGVPEERTQRREGAGRSSWCCT